MIAREGIFLRPSPLRQQVKNAIFTSGDLGKDAIVKHHQQQRAGHRSD
jgi:hypothetical protein